MGSHRSLWGHNKSKNKLTAALFLEHDDVKHTVYCLILIITVFKTVKFPAGISNLAASLANVDRNTLSLNKEEDALKNIILH